MADSRSARLVPIFIACAVLGAGANFAASVTLHDDQAAFEAATGAVVIPIPLAEDLTPAFNLPGWGCDEQIVMPFGSNAATLSAPAALPDPSLPGMAHPACVANAGELDPVFNVIVANGEDDYEIVFDAPVHAVGLELLTNGIADETITFRDDLGDPVFAVNVGPLTDPLSPSFVGFEFPVPVRSLFVDSANGVYENEGIRNLFASEVYDSDHDGQFPPQDCDNDDPTVFEGAVERMDGVDNDCNGLVDEGLDDDGDGVPDLIDLCPDTTAGSSVDPTGCAACTAQESDVDGDGYPAPADCNDDNPTIYPDAPESCNGTDDDCDGTIDEGFDLDGDGFSVCGGDCNDADHGTNPVAVELPGNVADENCDGEVVCSPCREWRNHGEYVSCVAHAVGRLVDSEALDPIRATELVAEAARSSVGRDGQLPEECGEVAALPANRQQRSQRAFERFGGRR